MRLNLTKVLALVILVGSSTAYCQPAQAGPVDWVQQQAAEAQRKVQEAYAETQRRVQEALDNTTTQSAAERARAEEALKRTGIPAAQRAETQQAILESD
jgi:ABC-type multidrug transport system fused ATPase/permease subunit